VKTRTRLVSELINLVSLFGDGIVSAAPPGWATASIIVHVVRVGR